MWELERYGDRTALIDDRGAILNYSELKESAEELTYDMEKRSLVFVLAENSIGSMLGYIAFISSGIVPVMLKNDIDDELFNTLYLKYRPEYLWLSATQFDRRKNTLIGSIELCSKMGYILLKTVYEKKDEIYPELALLLTTSGSTGSPKFVRQSYANIKANTDSIIEYLGLNEYERAITSLPMNYTYGLSIINTHLMVGATLLVTKASILQKEFWDFFSEYEATSISGVPYTYEMLDKLKIYNMKLPTLKTMTQAGGKLPPKLHKKFAEYANQTNRNFIVMYGQCEATARMAYLPSDKSIEKYGSMGVAIPGGRFELTDTDGNVIEEPNIAGELVYYGKNVTLGYANERVDLRKGDERNGRLETGDIAKMDRDGYYYIIGRKKRFLKLYGNRVNLDETEALIKDHFMDVDVACTGEDDRMYIFVTDESTGEDIRQFISNKIRINAAAFSVITVDEIPHNNSGKTFYSRLEAVINTRQR